MTSSNVFPMTATSRGGAMGAITRPAATLSVILLFGLVLVALSSPMVSASSSGGGDYWYLPAIMPIDYDVGNPVMVFARTLRSRRTLVPRSHHSVPMLHNPRTAPHAAAMTIGEVLVGERIEVSPIELQAGVNVTCRVVATSNPGDTTAPTTLASELSSLVRDEYRGYIHIDGLDGYDSRRFRGDWHEMQRVRECEQLSPSLETMGFPLGCRSRNELNNHLGLTIRFRRVPSDDGRIGERIQVVGFELDPKSIDWAADDATDKCDPSNPLRWLPTPLSLSSNAPITWSISASWIETHDATWNTRWNRYLDTSVANTETQIHWFAVANNAVVVLCLVAIVTFVLFRSLRYDWFVNRMGSKKEARLEIVGWIQLYADVFRPPARPTLLAVAVANGCQLLCTASVVLLFALLGFFAPDNRGGLLTCALLVFAVFASFANGVVFTKMMGLLRRGAGVVTAPLQDVCGGSHRSSHEEGTAASAGILKGDRRTVALSALAYGGPLLVATIVVCAVVASAAPDAVSGMAAVPALAGLLLFSVGMSLIGAWVCECKRDRPSSSSADDEAASQHPRHADFAALPREIPKQPWYLHDALLLCGTGTIPFGAIFIQLVFIMQAVWCGMPYFVFAFLTITFVLWVLSVVGITVAIVYFTLAKGNHRWWWRSFNVPGSYGVHVILYSILFFKNRAAITSVTGTVIYFTYMLFFAVAYALAAGCIGFTASFVFVKYIYSTVTLEDKDALAIGADPDVVVRRVAGGDDRVAASSLADEDASPTERTRLIAP